jgi:hypothetical protein
VPGIPGQSLPNTIARLVETLEPVRGRGRTGGLSAGWLLAGWLGASAAVVALGPLRPGLLDQITASPRFLLENLLGLACGAALAVVGFQLCIPGPSRVARVGFAFALLGLWAGAYALALLSPALPPSMLGKRPGCELQVLGLAAPLLVVALIAARRLAPLQPAWTGAILAAASGAIPALLMQFACMYEPSHILAYHLAPVGLLTLLGAAIAPRLLSPSAL